MSLGTSCWERVPRPQSVRSTLKCWLGSSDIKELFALRAQCARGPRAPSND